MNVYIYTTIFTIFLILLIILFVVNQFIFVYKEEKVNTPCFSSLDCGDGLICVNDPNSNIEAIGICKVPSEGICINNNDCLSGNCVSGKCQNISNNIPQLNINYPLNIANNIRYKEKRVDTEISENMKTKIDDTEISEKMKTKIDDIQTTLENMKQKIDNMSKTKENTNDVIINQIIEDNCQKIDQNDLSSEDIDELMKQYNDIKSQIEEKEKIEKKNQIVKNVLFSFQPETNSKEFLLKFYEQPKDIIVISDYVCVVEENWNININNIIYGFNDNTGITKIFVVDDNSLYCIQNGNIHKLSLNPDTYRIMIDENIIYDNVFNVRTNWAKNILVITRNDGIYVTDSNFKKIKYISEKCSDCFIGEKIDDLYMVKNGEIIYSNGKTTGINILISNKVKTVIPDNFKCCYSSYGDMVYILATPYQGENF